MENSKSKILTIIALLCSIVGVNAQNTVGLISNSSDAFDGYTLFAPIGSTTTYLINNCGEKVHSWPSTYRPGQSVYLLENGNLLRTGNTNNDAFDAGGTGGVIEMIDWEGNVIWDYTISSASECQHHDVEYLPNGNILAIVWKSYTELEAALAGRTKSGTTLWSEKIIEIQPDYSNNSASIVWEWQVWDHLVQDENAAAENFGSVENSPELIDLNFVSGPPTASDWLHINSVDYNAELDQIVLSNHNFSEVWIIDHSTTTEESKGSTGGTYGKGGDLLYRWGNPKTYGQGSNANQKLFVQHNAQWIPSGSMDSGKIMVFNNQAGSDYSTVDVLSPPIDAVGNYSYTGSAYAPTDFDWTYTATPASDFYAVNISGAQRLPNGNTLICEGPNGRFFEVDYSGITVWEYISPISRTGIINQGSIPNGNLVFRAERYPMDFIGLEGRDLTSKGYIESGSTFPCVTYTDIKNLDSVSISIYPNPTNTTLSIEADFSMESIEVFSLVGEKLLSMNPNSKTYVVNVSVLKSGNYVVKISDFNKFERVKRISIIH
jgi:hypothetical protein